MMRIAAATTLIILALGLAVAALVAQPARSRPCQPEPAFERPAAMAVPQSAIVEP